MTIAATADSSERTGLRGRRRPILVAASVLLASVVALTGLRLEEAHLTFPYEGPSDAVRPGGDVEVRAPADTCGPLIVSLHSPSILGQWNQTHSGNAVNDVFDPDRKAWWSWRSGSFFTPVPCSIGGVTHFTLPADVTSSTVAACDMDQRCAKIRVELTKER